ncbi:MAG: outer membrane protein assembly factor BamD [Gemmataceae bacterium]|nr:outer membrane protein assembly factor BamD [Gemmataceae bacterium]
MIKASSAHRCPPRLFTRLFCRARCALGLSLLLAAGCVSFPQFPSLPSMPWKKQDTGKGPVDSLVWRGEGMEKDKLPLDGTTRAELEGAKRLYQEKEYARAESLFAGLAKNTKNPVPVLDDALYFEADCQYLQGNFRTAEGTLKKYLKEFRTGAHADKANRRLFDIANYWLDNTRAQMQAYEEQREGKRWLVLPASFVSLSKDRPFVDAEGHALQCLEEVRLNDIGGPLGEKALFYIATVKFFREDYREADYYYSQLYEHYPNSPLAPKAIKQAIICKQIGTGGTAYDGRTVEESRKLLDAAVRAYPELAGKDYEWIQRQLVAVNLQQADRDFNIAEFYKRTGHPGSAYFYYELVRRRYPNTDYADMASTRMGELRATTLSADASSSNPVQTLQRWLNPSAPPSPENTPRVLPPSFTPAAR